MKLGAHTVSARRMTADDLCVVGGLMRAVEKTVGLNVKDGGEIGIPQFINLWPELLASAELLMSGDGNEIELSKLPLDEAVNAIAEFAAEWLEVNSGYVAENVAPAVTAAATGFIELARAVEQTVEQ